MIIAVVTFALSHMGVLIFMSTSQGFARVDTAWMTLWTNVNRGYKHYVKEFAIDVSISPLFGIFSGLILFTLWRIVSSNSALHPLSLAILITLCQTVSQTLDIYFIQPLNGCWGCCTQRFSFELGMQSQRSMHIYWYAF